MAFPADPLDVTVEIAPGADLTADSATWVWTDITSSTRLKDRIRITVGRQDESARVAPATCRLRLDNRSGNFTPRNPLGAYYGSLGRNTPLRVRVDMGTGPVDRFTGFVSSWPPRWDKSGNDATVPIEANGVLRRLGQGASPVESALRRAGSGSNPVAYWPLEDGVDSTQAASGLGGGGPMTVAAGIMDFVDAGPVGSDGSAQPNVDAGNQLIGQVVGGSATAWQMSLWFRGQLVDGASGSAFFVPLEVRTDVGHIYRLVIQSPAAQSAQVAQFDDESQTFSNVHVSHLAPGGYWYMDGQWHQMRVTLQQVGADVSATLYIDDESDSATWTGLTLSKPVQVNAIGDFSNSFGDVSLQMQEIQVAHIGVWNTATLVDQYDAGLGYAGEYAHDRLARLCAEEGVPLVIPTVSAGFGTPMGPQPTGDLLDLLYECADADQGVIYESGFGLGYLPREHRYNRAVDLALDFDLGQIAEPPEPTDDDQQLRNRIIVRRTGGSSAVAEDTDSIAATGLYDEEVTVNLADDSRLSDHAAWRLRLGTVDEMRWPLIPINLAASPELIDDWLPCGVGSRATAVNPPDEVAGDNIDVIIEGYSETLGYKDWDVSLNCSPAPPWDVGAYGTARYSPSLSRLNGPIASGSTSVSVTTIGVPWTTDPTSVPLDVEVGGERWTVTAITGTASPQTFTVTRSVNGVVKAHATATPVRLWTPAIYAL